MRMELRGRRLLARSAAKWFLEMFAQLNLVSGKEFPQSYKVSEALIRQ